MPMTTRRSTRRPTIEQIKAMTPEQREARADELVPGLAQGARMIWILEGKNFQEQLDDYRATQTTNDEEHNMTTATTEAPKTAKTTKAKPAKDKTLMALPVTTKDIAERCGVTPKELRVFLRANKDTFPKPEGQHAYGWTKLSDPQVKKLIKAVKATEVKADEKVEVAA
jgi:hypothetical protein